MKRWMITAAVAAVASMALAATASADVPRYQTETATLTVALQGPHLGKIHTFTVTRSQCDGSFVGTGSGNSAAGGATETIVGSFVDGNLSFSAVYGTFIPGYTWTYDGPLSGGGAHDSLGGHFDVTASFTVTATSNWKNHGEYVKSQGGGSDAAHSCLGKPIPYSWSASGTIDATAAGTAVTLPVAGEYRIDVSGTWTNGQWGWVDAEYTNDGAGGYADGFDRAGYLLGANFGDLMVGGAFVNWGAYSALHAYSYTGSFAAGALNLTVFDGEGGVAIPGWYGDNTGGLDYTVTYVGS